MGVCEKRTGRMDEGGIEGREEREGIVRETEMYARTRTGREGGRERESERERKEREEEERREEREI